jgi:hypothetical protein
LARKSTAIEPGSAKSMTISFRPSRAPIGNIRSGGSWKPSVTSCRLAASFLPERRKNGTPAHRQLSISTRTAAMVSVRESGATPSSSRVPGVLAADDALHVDGPERVEDLGRLLAQVPGVQRGGWLHGQKSPYLQQVRDDHVPVGAGVVVEAGAALDRERLRHVDLHVADVVAVVPDRLEQAVREPEGQDVVDGLLAEEVVDPEDLGLVEDRVDRVVQRASGFQVGAERLLDDDPRPGREARGTEHGHGRFEGPRRDGEVEQPSRCATDLLLRPLDRGGRRGGVVGARAGEGERLPECLPGLAGRLAGPEPLDRFAGEVAELLVAHSPPGRADDPVLLGQQTDRGEVEQPRQQLARGQVTRRPEQDDDVVLRPGGSRHSRRCHCGLFRDDGHVL